jgi:hypothetical protein
MKSVREFAVILMLFVSAQLVIAQGVNAKAAPSVPIVDVNFKDDQTVTGLVANPVLAYPLECSTDGKMLIEMLSPPDFRQHVLYLVLPSKGARRLDATQMTDLDDVQVVSHYLAPSSVAVLVYATREGAGPKYFERHYYIATFDNDGAYKSAIQIPDEIVRPRNVGAFDNGMFIVSGVDQKTPPSTSRLTLLSADGSVLSVLDPPEEFRKEYEKVMNSSESQGGRIAPAMQMVPFLDGILLVSRSTRIPVLEVKSSGDIREVKLHLRKGQEYVVDSIIPSTDKWFVRFNVVAPLGKSFSNDPVLYGVDPSNGMLLKRFHLVGALGSEILCASDGQLLALRQNDNGHFVEMKGHPRIGQVIPCVRVWSERWTFSIVDEIRRLRSLRAFERNGDLDEAAGAADATACSRIGSC